MGEQPEKDSAADEPIPADLGQAGSVIDHAIHFLVEKQVDELSIASALLGGALGLLSHALDDKAIEAILNNAIASVRAGHLRPPAES